MKTPKSKEQLHADRFFSALDKSTRAGERSKAGKRLVKAGFKVVHTGGGCLAWERPVTGHGKHFDSYVVMITDDGGTGLGDDVKDPEGVS